MLARLKQLSRSIKREFAVYRRVLADPRTPRRAKILLWCAGGYLAMPFDLIPDWIPLLGQIDDVIIVPALVYMALRMIPKDVVADCRRAVENEISGRRTS